MLNENSPGIIATAWADRPVLAALWSLLATSEHAFWHASFVAQALIWPLLGMISALLWIHLFPGLQRYAIAVACVAVAPIISNLQMVTANIALAHLLSVVLSYTGFLLLLRFVMADDRFGRVAVGLSVPILSFRYTSNRIRTTSFNCSGYLTLVIVCGMHPIPKQTSSLARDRCLHSYWGCCLCDFFHNSKLLRPTWRVGGQSLLYLQPRANQPRPFHFQGSGRGLAKCHRQRSDLNGQNNPDLKVGYDGCCLRRYCCRLTALRQPKSSA